MRRTTPAERDDAARRSFGGANLDEIIEFYERYIAAFNAQDASAFPGFFHLPVTVVPLPAADGEVTAANVVTDAAQLWPKLPAMWTHSTIDDIRVLGSDAEFTPRSAFVARDDRRPALVATVTRWADDEPYAQFHVLYVLGHVDGRLGITMMVPLIAAAPAGRATA